MQYKPRGSGLIELILWLCFLVPGIIYTIWRGQKKEYKCPSCGENSIVRNTDMRAREYIEKKNLVKCPYCAELIKSEAVVCKHCKKELKSV